MKLQKADNLSKLDQVLQYMKQESAGIKILDVRENLLNKKSTEDLDDLDELFGIQGGIWYHKVLKWGMAIFDGKLIGLCD